MDGLDGEADNGTAGVKRCGILLVRKGEQDNAHTGDRTYTKDAAMSG